MSVWRNDKHINSFKIKTTFSRELSDNQKLHKAKIVSFEPAAAVRSAGGAPPPFHIKKEKLYGRWTFWPGTPALSKNTALPDLHFHPSTIFPPKVPNYEEPNISFEMQSLKIKTSSEPSLLLLVFFWQKFYFIFSRAGPATALHRVIGKFLPLFAIFSCVFSWKSGVFSAAVRQSHSNKALR